MKRLLRLLIILSLTFSPSHFLTSCTQDAYEKGEGKYSLMRADFVEAHANGQKEIDRITTDDGDQFAITKTFTTKWVTTADSTYRCILYYNKVEEGSGKFTAEPLSIGLVPCPKITPISELNKEMKTDPVKFESAWLSKTGKYLNLSLYLMTGTADDEDATQTLHVVQDTIMTNTDATRTCFLRLYHDQGGIPEYYSSQVYASILTSQIDADSVRISINSYKGEVTKFFSLR
ncbi:MAG: hypothetical protein J5658_14475 [Prevotella sp.]|nr:hypothetical protein [Prevotella sp.]